MNIFSKSLSLTSLGLISTALVACSGGNFGAEATATPDPLEDKSDAVAGAIADPDAYVNSSITFYKGDQKYVPSGLSSVKCARSTDYSLNDPSFQIDGFGPELSSLSLMPVEGKKQYKLSITVTTEEDSCGNEKMRLYCQAWNMNNDREYAAGTKDTGQMQCFSGIDPAVHAAFMSSLSTVIKNAKEGERIYFRTIAYDGATYRKGNDGSVSIDGGGGNNSNWADVTLTQIHPQE